jgi:hypothetical protein
MTSVGAPSGGGASGGDAGGTGLAGQARWTEPEQLEAVFVYAVTGAPRDFADDKPETGIIDFARPPTSGADDVVVMRRLADHVGMLAGREIETLDGTESLQDLERAEDRGPPDAESPGASGGDKLGCREMTGLVSDQDGQGATRLRQTVAGAVEGRDDRFRVSHLGRLA